MYYAVQHKTQFHYTSAISESVTEVHMQPRSEGTQRCLRFKLGTYPQVRISETYDFLGNAVHFFNVPSFHEAMIITAESTVEILPLEPLPDHLTGADWDALDIAVKQGDFWDMLMPSARIPDSLLLSDFVSELGVKRSSDPLTFLHQLNSRIYDAFDYVPNVTAVDSLIDDALESRKGVCQDFTHIMIGVTRSLGIPSRYVSGYLFHRTDDTERSTPDASHAWLEVYLPSLGWIGFDPTNNVIAGERHIRVAVGRDYTDVPPTRGIFKGKAESELEVEVHITPAEKPYELDVILPIAGWNPDDDAAVQQIQQQQQQ